MESAEARGRLPVDFPGMDQSRREKITAEFLGVQNSKVVLKLPNGKVSFIPILNLSPGDNSFIRTNGFEYFAPWQAWPLDAGIGS